MGPSGGRDRDQNHSPRILSVFLKEGQDSYLVSEVLWEFPQNHGICKELIYGIKQRQTHTHKKNTFTATAIKILWTRSKRLFKNAQPSPEWQRCGISPRPFDRRGVGKHWQAPSGLEGAVSHGWWEENLNRNVVPGTMCCSEAHTKGVRLFFSSNPWLLNATPFEHRMLRRQPTAYIWRPWDWEIRPDK